MAIGQTRSQEIQATIFKMINANTITAGAAEAVWAGTAGKRIRLLGWCLSTSVAAALEFQDSGTAGTVIAQTPLLATAGVHNSPNLGDGVLLAAGSDLDLDVTSSSAVSGMVWGVEEGSGYLGELHGTSQRNYRLLRQSRRGVDRRSLNGRKTV